jgi:hypothetical protein
MYPPTPRKTDLTVPITVTAFLLVAAALVALVFWAWPQYAVYSQTLRGKAALQEAEYTRQIAQLDAEAQVVLAEGEARANAALVDGLEGPDNYLKWLYIQMLDKTEGQKQIIYVPQSEFLPMGEAGRSVE